MVNTMFGANFNTSSYGILDFLYMIVTHLLQNIFFDYYITTAATTSLPMSRHAPPPKSPAPPPPLPPGYHKRQRCGPSGVDPSPSRPLSPMEQFDMTVEYHVWEKEASGEPTKEDLEVRCTV